MQSRSTKHKKVACQVCGHKSHILVEHVTKRHGMEPAAYVTAHPGSPLWSSYGFAKILEHSRGTRVKSEPRARAPQPLKELFPTFGVQHGYSYEGAYPVFSSPGELTPKADSHYVFPEEQTVDCLTILEKPQRNRVYIKGWSGTGKTAFCFNLAAKCNAEVLEWNADSFQQRADLIGRYIVKDGETIFQYGILPIAMMRGVWLIINEIDTINPLAMNILKPLLEDPPRLTILENGGEVIHAHPDFRIIATANTWARGDGTGMFVNTHTQSDADARRWSARILIDYMQREDEIAMLRGYFADLSEKQCGQFVDVATRVRDAFKGGKIDKTFSAGELVVWAENYLTCGKSVQHAARISFLNALEKDVATSIDEMISAVFGREARS